MFKSKRFWVALAITAITLLLAFRGVQFDQVVRALGRVNYWYFFPAVVVFWLSYAARVFRWQLLFHPYRVPWSRVLSTLCIGYFLSNITPLRIGDIVRAYLIGTLGQVPVPRSLSTVVVERTMDALTVVLFLLLLLPIIPNIPVQARSGGIALGLVGVGLLVALALVSLRRERGLAFLKRLTARIQLLQRESIWRGLEHLIDGFAVLHSARTILGVVAWSILVWFWGAVLNWIVMRAMGLELGLDAATLVLVVTSLAVTAAPTPGQLGVFHLAAQFTLHTVYGVDQSVALAYAFVIHAYVYVWLMVLGTLFIWREGLSYGKLQAVGGGAQEPTEIHSVESEL